MSGITEVTQTDPVAWLKHDHQIIRGYLETLARSSIADGRSTFEELKKILSLHNAIEENLVYPTIAKVVGRQDQAMELFHETAEADILVFSLSQAAKRDDDDTFKAGLAQLTSAILAHVQLEETQAFPALESAPPAVLESLASDIVTFTNSVTTPLRIAN
jgi:hemerythrin superfamily protein